MKKNLKSFLSLVLVVAIIFSSVYIGLNEIGFSSFLVVKSRATNESDLTFTLNNDGVSYSVTGCNTSADGEIIIPNTYDGLTVTGIGTAAFMNCSEVTTISIPDTVTNIGEAAFAFCTSLTDVTIPYGVKDLSYTFFGCESLVDVTIPDSVESMISAFSECTGLVSITIPDSVIDMEGAFMNCTSLVSVKLSDNVTNIKDAFLNCQKLKSITIPASVTSIGEYAFDKCISLEEVAISGSVTNIDYSAFGRCYNIANIFYGGSRSAWANITIGNNNESLNNAAIHYNSTSHQYSDKWTIDIMPTYDKEGSKSRHCLYCDAKTDVISIPRIVINDIMYMESSGFFCGEEVTYILKLKAGVTVSGSVFGAVFDPAILEPVESKSGACTTTDSSGYERNNFSGIFATGMKYNTDNTFVVAHMDVKPSAFNRDSEYVKFTFKIKDYSISETAVDFYCFEFIGDHETTSKDCNVLVSHFDVEITETTNHNYTWEYNYEKKTKTKTCSVCGDKLTEALLLTDVLTLTLNSDGTGYTITDCVSDYSCDLEIPATFNGIPVTAIGTDAFRDCKGITSVIIPDSATSIGGSAFRNCTNLTKLVFPKNITSIPGAVCFGCIKLESIIIPDGVLNIGGYAFNGCTALKTAVIPNSATNIGGSVFANCADLIIICNKDSAAELYADTNNISFVLNTSNTLFDISSKNIYTDILGANLSSIILGSDSISYTMNTSLAGTGAVICVFKDGALHSQYSLVVRGDANGDSVCDVLDCFAVERAASGNVELSGVYAEAGDSNGDNVINIADYQAIINKAIS